MSSLLEKLRDANERVFAARNPILDEVMVLHPRAVSWASMHAEGRLSDEDYAAAMEFIANPVYLDDGTRVETWRRMASRVPSENGRGRIPEEWPWN